MKHIYLVMTDWAFDGGSDIETEAFEDYDNAKLRYEELIKRAKTEDFPQNSFETNDVEYCGEVYYEEDESDAAYALETAEYSATITDYPNRWTWFEKGNYNSCHYEIRIIRTPLK